MAILSIKARVLPKRTCYTNRRYGREVVQEPDQVLVENIKARLKSAGLNRRSFAKRVGVHPSVVSNWLNFNRPILIEYFKPIAVALGTTVSKLFVDLTVDKKPVDLDTALRIVTEHARAGSGAAKE